MTSQADYTAEQWKLLTRIPAAIGLSVMLAEDQGGRRAARKELAALAAAPDKVAAQFAGNALVQAVLPEVKANAAAEQVRQHSREKGQTEQRIFEATYRMCQQVATVLSAISTAVETDGYKRFAAGVGAEVARAAADAEYLGIGGGTLSSHERKLLRALCGAMGLDLDD